MASDPAALTRDEFVELVERYHDDLLRLAVAMARDPRLAEDAVQACWHAAWRSRLALRDPDRVAAWLFTVTANEVRRLLRRQRLGRLLQGRIAAPAPPEPPDPRHVDLARALGRLAVDDRQLIALRYGLGLTSEEIGPMLGLSGPGVRRRLQRVLADLRRELRDA